MKDKPIPTVEVYNNDETMEQDCASPAEKRSAFREIMSWIIPFAAAILVALCLRTYVFELISVDGPSMLDTLVTGEVVYINKLAYRVGDLRRGDVVLCHFPDKKSNYIKRLVALPGDTVEIAAGQLYINGAAVQEPYLSPDRVRAEEYGPIVLGADEVMVMGDNRGNSADSRTLGALDKHNVLGRGVFVLWPFQSARSLSIGKP